MARRLRRSLGFPSNLFRTALSILSSPLGLLGMRRRTSPREVRSRGVMAGRREANRRKGNRRDSAGMFAESCVMATSNGSCSCRKTWTKRTSPWNSVTESSGSICPKLSSPACRAGAFRSRPEHRRVRPGRRTGHGAPGKPRRGNPLWRARRGAKHVRRKRPVRSSPEPEHGARGTRQRTAQSTQHTAPVVASRPAAFPAVRCVLCAVCCFLCAAR
jgi:hypothetical protein